MASTTGYKAFTRVTTGIANAVATDVLTVSVPNASVGASILVHLTGSLGAGGAVGAYEATGTVAYRFIISKLAGVVAVVTTSASFGTETVSISGGATMTITAAASAVSGSTGANTFTIQVTISRGSGSSTNHRCAIYAELLDPSQTATSRVLMS